MKDIHERLSFLRGFFGLSQPDVATKFGIPYNTYRKYENGPSKPGADAIEGITRAGINANWLLTGEGEMLLADRPKPLSKPIQDAVDAFFPGTLELASSGKPYDWGDTTDALQSDAPPHAPYGFVLVPRYDVSASMGNGAVIHSEQIVDHLAFREQWVRLELNTSPKNLVLISAIGDSMEPTLRAGDLLLIDRGSEGVKQDAIYAFAMNGELRVKRMQLKLDGSLVVRSDNSKYEAESLNNDQIGSLHIVGRVVWSGRRM